MAEPKTCRWDIPEICARRATVTLLMLDGPRIVISLDVCRWHVESTVQDMAEYASQNKIPAPLIIEKSLMEK